VNVDDLYEETTELHLYEETTELVNERDGESIAYLGFAVRRPCGVQKPLFGKVPGADTFS